MIGRRLLLATMVFAGSATACTAIVLAKIGDTPDYAVDGSLSSSSSSKVDECSLLKDQYDRALADANPCSTCIDQQCSDDVAFACNRGKTEKSWFNGLKNCARSPWNGFSPPEANASSYACGPYEKALEPIPDKGSDTQREREAQRCVHEKCTQGALPACKLCEVNITKPDGKETALLRDDECGGCLVEKCEEILVRCCNTQPMNDFVRHCAFTNESSNKATCKELGSSVPDAGNRRSDYGDAGDQCLADISACFKANCTSRPACN